MKWSKARAQAEHARRRAYQRLGVRMGEASLAEIVRLIRGGQSVCLERQSHRVSVHRVTLRCGPVNAVYDRTRGTVVSVLSDDMVRGMPGWGRVRDTANGKRQADAESGVCRLPVADCRDGHTITAPSASDGTRSHEGGI